MSETLSIVGAGFSSLLVVLGLGGGALFLSKDRNSSDKKKERNRKLDEGIQKMLEEKKRRQIEAIQEYYKMRNHKP